MSATTTGDEGFITTAAIPTPDDFDFKQCLHYLNRSDLERLHVISHGVIRKLILPGQQRILVELCQSTAEPALRITYPRGRVDGRTHQVVTAFVEEWFDLARDISRFYELAGRDAILRQLVSAYRGLRLIRIHDLFQALCWAILGQQVNLKFAYTLYSRFIEKYGDSEIHAGDRYWLFPKPEVVADVPAASLQRLQLTRNKSEFIIGVARAIADDEISKNSLLQLGDPDQAREALLALRGVGPWTASYVLMRCLGHIDAFPIEDIGLHNALRIVLARSQKPDIEEIQQISTAWKGWRAYATFYLYRSLL